MMKLGLICLLSCVSVVNVTVSLPVESQLICSHQPIVALVGDDVILPCHLEPPISASSETVEWTKPGLDPKYVHLQQAGKLNFELQNPSYYFRTRLFVDEMTRGNVSMKISKVETSDAGKYQCFLPSIQKTASIQLTVEESDVIGSHEPIKVAKGNDTILPCHLEPPIDVRSLSVDWKHNGTTVHLYRYGNNSLVDQDERFKDRTSLFDDEMAKGNISLKLTNVNERDEGDYTCFVQQNSKNKTGKVTLSVVDESGKGKQTSGESDVIGSDKPIKVAVGHDVILPCHLKPPIDVTSLTVMWEHSGTTVHSYRYRMDYLVDQDERFKDRTSLFYDEMAKGNISLKLTNVTEEDEGNYTCFVQQNSKNKRGKVTLSVDTDTEEPAGISTGGKIAIVVVGAILVAGVCFVIWWKRKRNGRDERGNYGQTATS